MFCYRKTPSLSFHFHIHPTRNLRCRIISFQTVPPPEVFPLLMSRTCSACTTKMSFSFRSRLLVLSLRSMRSRHSSSFRSFALRCGASTSTGTTAFSPCSCSSCLNALSSTRSVYLLLTHGILLKLRCLAFEDVDGIPLHVH